MKLTLRFSAQNKPASLFIRFFRWILCSHVEAVMADGRTLGARLIGGVKIREAVAYSWVRDVVVEVPEALWVEALSMQGWRYDLIALFAFLFRIKMQKSGWVTCVEMWAELLKKHGVIIVPDTRTIDPYQLYLMLLNLNHGRAHTRRRTESVSTSAGSVWRGGRRRWCGCL